VKHTKSHKKSIVSERRCNSYEKDALNSLILVAQLKLEMNDIYGYTEAIELMTVAFELRCKLASHPYWYCYDN
jgi:hypothetical protein